MEWWDPRLTYENLKNGCCFRILICLKSIYQRKKLLPKILILFSDVPEEVERPNQQVPSHQQPRQQDQYQVEQALCDQQPRQQDHLRLLTTYCIGNL